MQALELHRKRSGHTEYEETEAKLRREKAEEDRRIEEWVARVQEELKNSMEKVNISFICSFPCKLTRGKN